MISRRLTFIERLAWNIPGHEVLDGWRSRGGAIQVLIVRQKRRYFVKAIVIDLEGTVRGFCDHHVECEEWMKSTDYIWAAAWDALDMRRMWSKALRPLGIGDDYRLDPAALSGLATAIKELKAL